MLKERKDIWIMRQGPKPSCIVQQAATDAGAAELSNEVRFLRLLEHTGYVPKLLKDVDKQVDGFRTLKRLYVEDVGDSIDITDEDEFRRHFLRMLWHFRKEGVVHGDLTGANIRVVNNVPKVIDWKQSRFAGEIGTDKRPEGDIFHAFEWLASLKDGRRIGTRFFAMWNAILDEDKPLKPEAVWHDVGTYYGDIAACAAASGFNVTATDISRPAIQNARLRFAGLPIDFIYADAILLGPPISCDIASCLSVYPYMLERHGDIDCNAYIETIIDRTLIFFFECQLYGDGHGPEEFKTARDIEEWLYERGANSVEAILESDVGRNTTRTLWKIK